MTSEAASFLEDLNAQYATVFFKHQRGEISDRDLARIRAEIEALRLRAERLGENGSRGR